MDMVKHSMCLSNVISNHHVQYNGMFTITTHFMAKHICLRTMKCLKKGKGLIVSTFLLLFVNKIMFTKYFFLLQKCFLFTEWVLFLLKMCFFSLEGWKGFLGRVLF